MAKLAIKAPKVINWPALKHTQLTLELSSRGLTNMTDDLAAERILVALHEAAHFLIAVHDGLELHDVRILGVRGTSLTAWGTGGVRFNLHSNQLLPVRFHYAGTIHDWLMTGQDTFASINDWLDGLEYLVGHCNEHQIDPDESLAISREEAQAVQGILSENWNLVRTLACALLVHSDASGHVDCNQTATLYKHAKNELLQPTGGQYGDVLDRETITRLGTNPPLDVERFSLKRQTRTRQQLWFRKFVIATANLP